MGGELPSGNNGMQEINFSDNELVHYVRNALKFVSLGDRGSYDDLVGVMHHKERLSPDEVAMLVTCLRALCGAITCLDDVYHGSLLSSIFGMSMWDYGPEVMDALIELVKSLAQCGKFLIDCLDMLVKNFIPPYTFLPLLKQPRGITRKDHVLSRVHSALESIAELVPRAPAMLLELVINRMPPQNENEAASLPVVVIYVENMFRLEKGPIGELVRDNMLKGVVDRLTELDVNISWEDILQDDSTKGIFELELEDLDDLEDDFEDGDELQEAFMSRKGLQGNINAGKLDSLLVLTFEHLESCKAEGRLDKVFGILLDAFTKTVLNVYKSKFTQFVMFYACALDPERCGTRFSKRLLDIFVSSDNTPITRMSAVAYLSSYLARGKFISTNLVTETLKRLSYWCLAYTEVQDSGYINPQADHVFYSGCQAIMYVLCFRMGSMVNVPWLKSQISLMPIEPVLKHRLDPLKVCLPSVVEEFLLQAKAAHLFTVSDRFIFNDLLESELSRAYGGIKRLDMFFPFDPCLLRKSDRFIRPNYIYWSMVIASNEEDDEEDEEGDDVARDVDDMATSYENGELNLDEFDLALNKMSITPKNHNFVRMPSKLRPSMSPPQFL